jgi:hypothetical protein
MESSKSCQLSLFTWTCAESEGQKEVVPMCPEHAGIKIRFNTFGTGMIVTCHHGRNHLVRLCKLEQFEVEREEARARLFPSALGQEVKVP